MNNCLTGVFENHYVCKFIEGFVVTMKSVQMIWLPWHDDYSKDNPALQVSVRWLKYIKVEFFEIITVSCIRYRWQMVENTVQEAGKQT